MSAENPIVLTLPDQVDYSSTPLESEDSYEARQGRPVESFAVAIETSNSHHSRASLMTAQSTSSLKSNLSSKRKHNSNRSQSSMSTSGTVSSYKVIFSTASKYDRWIWAILSIPLVVVLIQLIFILVASTQKADFSKSQKTWILSWTLILILALYMMVLPKQLDIRNNGTIGIKTFLITYQFGDICRAYKAGEGVEDFFRARYKFATCWEESNRVVIRRRDGHWDVVVSPSDTENFLQAIYKAVQNEEAQTESSSIAKPNLSAV